MSNDRPDSEKVIGAFYWVLIKEAGWQPARFTGTSGDSVGETWDFLGEASVDGHHRVSVMGVGRRIEH